MRTFFAIALTLLLPPTAVSAETLTILHTNDVHSRLEPITKYDNTCPVEDNAAGECFGGSARLATAVTAERAAADGPVLLLDGGDQFQGSLFYTHHKGAAAAQTMNAIGYDAMTVGNHEFDDGPEVLARFVDGVAFPVLMANAVLAPGSALAGKIPATAVLEEGGQRYGIIGITPIDTPELSSPGDSVTFTSPVAAVQEAVAALEADGVDRIILLSHSGHRVEKALAAVIPGIDVVVGGHSNTFLSNVADGAAGPYPVMVRDKAGNDTPVVQAGDYGKYLGKLRVTFDEAGNVTAAQGEPLLLDAAVAEDAAMVDMVAALAVPLDAVRNEVVAETAEAIDGSVETCRAQECAMGNLVADAMLARVADRGIAIAIQNGGGVRASIDAGPITMGDVLTVLPFQNTLATFALNGADVVAALENGVSAVEDGAGRFAQVAGLRYVADLSVPAGEGRIVSVEVSDGAGGFTPIDPEATYGVVSNDFLRRGGDGYSVFAKNATNAYDGGPNLEDVVADYLSGQTPVTPVLDGRVTIK